MGKESGSGDGWSELLLTLIIALAAVGTAWAGFQSAKWSGVQANSYAQAGAARTESTRASTKAGQLGTVDVISFTEWLSALNEETADDPDRTPLLDYEPDPKTLSGVLFQRLREEFRPAVRAWLETRPLTTEGAPSTPFVMPEYRLATQGEADKLLTQAEDLSAKARQSNQRSDNYVLTAVLLALVLFFASITSRARAGRNRQVLFALTVVSFTAAAILLLTFPVEI